MNLPYNNGFFCTTGIDYTFSIGNGVGINIEHMFFSYNSEIRILKNLYNVISCMVTYPLSFFNRLSLLTLYSYETKNLLALLNYKYDFSKFSLYVIPFYSLESENKFSAQNLIQLIKGPGLMMIFQFNY